jgi:hypothetical protein
MRDRCATRAWDCDFEAAQRRRTQRGREGAARGNGAPASDRAGVWGGAPSKYVPEHQDAR